jgi:hypothetical protein
MINHQLSTKLDDWHKIQKREHKINGIHKYQESQTTLVMNQHARSWQKEDIDSNESLLID